MKDLLFRHRLNIQLFAADGGTGAGGAAGEGNAQTDPANPNGTGQPAANETFTRADIDRAVTKALATREQALEADFQTRVDDAVNAAVAEQQRLAQLSEEERKEEARKAAQKELEDRENLLNEKLLRIDVSQELVKKGLDPELTDYVLDNDLDASVKRIENLEAIISKQVEAGITKALTKSGVPSSPTGKAMTRDEIMAIEDRVERQKAIQKHIHLFD